MTPGDGASRVADRFRDWYGSEPEGVWHAPGRVNLIGEHTDYNEGWVLPFALDRGVVVAASRRGDGVLALRSRQEPDGAEAELASLTPGSVPGWAAYPAGVAWALREAGHQAGGASLAIDSDLPQGAGLSSSAALECATALALTSLYGLTVPRFELAALTRRAENEMAGVPSGIMDQSASLLSAAGHALLLDCRSGETSLVPFDPPSAGLSMLVIDTRVRHAHSDGRYALRRQECEQAARALGLRSLRDAGSPSQTMRLDDPVLASRARHVISDNQRVLETAALLRDGDLTGIGALLTASHVSLRDDFEISWPQADVAVETACEAGALGARMVGGGFGGSVIALAVGTGAAVCDAVTEEFARQGWQAPTYLPAPPSAGARQLC